MCCENQNPCDSCDVPILTQSENWALCDRRGEFSHKLASFQSSPSPKTGRYAIRASTTYISGVPILTQSENWALFCSSIAIVSRSQLFQSSPSPKTGRYLKALFCGRYKERFQSSPSPKTGRYMTLPIAIPKTEPVPILTQSENWALFAISSWQCSKYSAFQSSPSPKTGRYVKVIP